MLLGVRGGNLGLAPSRLDVRVGSKPPGDELQAPRRRTPVSTLRIVPELVCHGVGFLQSTRPGGAARHHEHSDMTEGKNDVRCLLVFGDVRASLAQDSATPSFCSNSFAMVGGPGGRSTRDSGAATVGDKARALP